MRALVVARLGRRALTLPSAAGPATGLARAAGASWGNGGGSSWGGHTGAPSFDAPFGARSLSFWGGGSGDNGRSSATVPESVDAAGAASELMGGPGAAAAEAAAEAAVETGPAALLGATVEGLVAAAAMAEGEARAEALEGTWLPTKAVQYLLTGLHDVSGLGWTPTLLVATAALRLATSPIGVSQQRRAVKVAQARPLMEEAVERFKAAQAAGDPHALKAHQERIADIWNKYDCHPVKMLAPMLVQMPVFLGMFGALRALAAAKVPSFVDGGALWFSDLSLADPTYMLPALTCLSFLAMLELGAADGMEAQAPAQQRQFKIIMRVIGLAIVPFSASMPAALHIYWTASNIFGIAQSRFLRIASVRSALHLPPLKSKATVVSAASAAAAKPVTFARPRGAGRK